MQGDHAVEAFDFYVFGDVVGHFAAGECAGSFGVFEHECRIETGFAHQRQRLLEVFLAFIVETGEHVGGESGIGYDAAYRRYAVEIPFAGIFAVHSLEHLVGA